MVLSSSSITGNSVVNPQGESLGDIKDLMIDVSDGRVVYAVLSFGGFLGLGDKLFAVPLNALQLDTERERFVLDVSREQLENAPGFDKDNWPATTDHEFVNSVYTHYGREPYYTSY
ncbi:MAG: PRC-barrel domain-containing protein [Rubricoccaceae bacterium]